MKLPLRRTLVLMINLSTAFPNLEECDATMLNRNTKAGNKKKKFKLIIHEKNK